jgi:hypothetical protein
MRKNYKDDDIKFTLRGHDYEAYGANRGIEINCRTCGTHVVGWLDYPKDIHKLHGSAFISRMVKHCARATPVCQEEVQS